MEAALDENGWVEGFHDGIKPKLRDLLWDMAVFDYLGDTTPCWSEDKKLYFYSRKYEAILEAFRLFRNFWVVSRRGRYYEFTSKVGIPSLEPDRPALRFRIHIPVEHLVTSPRWRKIHRKVRRAVKGDQSIKTRLGIDFEALPGWPPKLTVDDAASLRATALVPAS